MKYRNCCDCGAPLQIDRNKLENYIKCEYYGTQYELDENNEIKDYQIELLVNGKKRKFYISNLECHKIFNSARRNLAGELHTNVVAEKYKLVLVEI